MTNADIIRMMSNEDLRDFILDVLDDPCAVFKCKCCRLLSNDSLSKCPSSILSWLESRWEE